MQPTVSVLTTSYNRADYIAAAIESVLCSSLSDFEYIIVDDGSTDQTVDIAKTYEKLDSRVKVYVNEKNLGDYRNRNKAASFAKGKYIKYVDSDDILYPHGLAVMLNSMEMFPEAGFGLSAKMESGRPYPVCLSPRETYLEHFEGYGHFHRAPGSAIIRRDAFEQEGGFSGERMIGDTELWFRLGRSFPMVKFPVDLYWSRTHAEQESQSAYARKQYQFLQKKVMAQAFSHEQCPLNEEEKKRVHVKIKKVGLIQTVKRFLPA